MYKMQGVPAYGRRAKALTLMSSRRWLQDRFAIKALTPLLRSYPLAGLRSTRGNRKRVVNRQTHAVSYRLVAHWLKRFVVYKGGCG